MLSGNAIARSENMNSAPFSHLRKRELTSGEANLTDPLPNIHLSQHRLNVKVTAKRARKNRVQLGDLRRSARVHARTFQEEHESINCVQSATSRLKKQKCVKSKASKRVDNANELGKPGMPERVTSSKYTDIPESGSSDPN